MRYAIAATRCAISGECTKPSNVTSAPWLATESRGSAVRSRAARKDLRQFDEALRDYEAALALSPTSPLR
jgi:hypothetical protein